MQVVDSISMEVAKGHPKRFPSASSSSYNITRVNLGDHFITLKQWQGSGPPLILVHGISSSGSTWESLIPALRKHFSPITLDLRGHGDSAKPNSGFLFDDYVSDLDGVINALGIEHPLLMGHSFGGLVTLGWASRYPDRAAGMVIIDSPLRIGKDLLPAFKGWIMLNAMPTAALTAWYRLGNPEWSMSQARRRARTMRGTARNVFVELRNDALANDGIDHLADAERVTSPILLVRGDPKSGSMVGQGDAEAFEKRVPAGRVFQIPGAGHGLHRNRVDEFVAATIPFLQDCVQRRLRPNWIGF
jgi:pimeloyl-ACP methyl ester carboxylesterase